MADCAMRPSLGPAPCMDELLSMLEAQQCRLRNLAESQHQEWQSEIHEALAQLARLKSAGEAVAPAVACQRSLDDVLETTQPLISDTDAYPVLPATSDASDAAKPLRQVKIAQDANPEPRRDAAGALQSSPASPRRSSQHSGALPSSPRHGHGAVPNFGSTLSERMEEPRELGGKGLACILPHLDKIAGILVILNTCLMFVELEVLGRFNGAILGLSYGVGPTGLSSLKDHFRAFDAFFDVAFLLELLLRVANERRFFFQSWSNWFDLFLVLAGVFDLVTAIVEPSPNGLFAVHIIRALFSLRALRTCGLFKGLRLLLAACQSFLPSLFWSMILLLVFMSAGSLAMGNLLQDFIVGDDGSMDERIWVWQHYGTAHRALYTMYEITFAGNWPTKARPVLDSVSQFYVVFFVLYITLIVFAVIRVVTAIFLKDTLEAAQNDAELQMVNQMRKKSDYIKRLEAVFKSIDNKGDGMITEERLTDILSNPKVHAYFETLDLDVTEGAALFHILDNGDGEVTMDEFIGGIMRCKGPARAIDQVAMHAEIKSLDSKMNKIWKQVRNSSASQSSCDDELDKAAHLRVFKDAVEQPAVLLRMATAKLS